ncbi:unnamed protein product [Pocillopora meandrina]|uniref:Uncharacterized protein n=1 Tax=Pocillopora meandrina TaxID=46732 RepID=A0AAU9WIP2_9CNID|nr:unnamed protein product [Pocillopora meandrina]
MLKVPGQRFTYKFDKLPYRYDPEVSQSRYQERKKISSDKSTSCLSGQSLLSSSFKQSTLSRAQIPLGSSISPSLIPSAARSTQASQVTTQQLSPQTRTSSNLRKITLKASVPLLFRKQDLLNCSTKSIPVSVIKRIAFNP